MQAITFEQLEQTIQARCSVALDEFQTTIRHAAEDNKDLSYISFFNDNHEHNLYGVSKLLTHLYGVGILELGEWKHLVNKIDNTIEQLSQLEREYREDRLKTILNSGSSE